MTIRYLPAALAMLLAACGGSGGDAGAAGQQAATQSPSPTAPAAQGGTSATAQPAAAATWWRPPADSRWTLQLSGTVVPASGATVVDADLFETPAAKIAEWHRTGLRVVCYFSAGSSEDWRPDFARFREADQGKAMAGWPGERWLDTRSANVRAIMAARLDMARDKGCDGVDPDNVDGYANDTGLALDAASQLDYNRWLAAAAHARGLAVGLKNDVEQVPALAAVFDFAVNEECHEHRECDRYAPFVAAGKPVLNIEYAGRYVSNANGARDALCAASRALGLTTQVLPLELDGSFRYACP